MSEAEFDSYLSLLSKFLRLRSRQRAELADELRDHLDSRLDELLAQGKSREQAIKIALEEFGDAAVLAEDFSRLASRRKKRFVMRCTAASAAVVAAVVLLSVAFAPPGPNGPGVQNVVAQQQPGLEDSGAIKAGLSALAHDAAAEAADGSVEQQAVAALDQKLDKVIPEIKFTETPLREVLDFVADSVDADVLIDMQGLEDESISIDDPISLSITRTQVAARTVLDFVLQPHGLAFVNRAGVIYVTTEAKAQERLTTKVYNVRDLLENATSHNVTTPAVVGGGGELHEGEVPPSGGGFFAVADSATAMLLTEGAAQIGGGGFGGMEGMASGMGGGMGSGGLAGPTGPAADLLNAIQQSTSGNWIDRDGNGGTMSLFNGLLVVRQTDEVQNQVQKLLEALREAGAAQPGGSVTVPKAGALHSNRAGGEIRNWPAMGLKTVAVVEPTWIESSGNLRSHPIGLRIEEVDAGGRGAAAGFQKGDVVLSWSADHWSKNAIDDNTIASPGRKLPETNDFESAKGHGVKAIVFAAIRDDADRKGRYTRVVLPLE